MAITSREATAALITSATFVAYMVGSSRAYGYDESLTIGEFVTTSAGRALSRQIVANNHPLLSLLEHVVFKMTGSDSEVVMRALPALVLALLCGVLVWCLWSATPVGAVAAAAYVATNPMMVHVGRQVRGYGLLSLLAVVATYALSRRRWRWYGVAVAAGVATHLYMVPVVALHGVYLLASRAEIRQFIRVAGLAAAVGGVPYLFMARSYASRAREGKVFHPDMPAQVASEILGRRGVAIAFSAVLVAAGAASLVRRNKAIAVAAGAGVAGFAVIWLVLQPVDFYPRFWVWAVPAAATALAFARPRWLLALVVVPIWAGVLELRDHYTADSMATRSAGAVVESAHGEGRDVCALGHSSEALRGYTKSYRRVMTANELEGCEVAVSLLPELDPEDALVRELRRTGAFEETTLPAVTPGLLFVRRP